ncbi:restriction endonuclease subunit S [Corynebacterium pacaense]|uniref:restriction endonuclease subunit S n=1 Tax=Corynebacterium pacaense TaxID=1816684 RepID=UPI001C4DDCD1|nr:restriction endonuclease subunit S [Corynebacterium pacaense]
MKVKDILVEFKENPRLGSSPEVLTLTERNGFVRQSDRFNKRLATEDTSKYKLIHQDEFAFNPYLLWAGAIARNCEFIEGVISPLYPTFRVKSGLDPAFAQHFLLSPQMIAKYDSIAFGSVPRRRRSSVQNFLNLSIPALPPLAEQRRIAEILDLNHRISSSLDQEISRLDELEKFSYLKSFGNDPTTTTTQEVAAQGKGSIRTGPFGSQLRHDEFVSEGIAVLGLDNVVANRFQWVKQRFITPEKYDELRRYKVTPGDVLVSIMGTTGRCAIVPDNIPTTINTKHICAITTDHCRILPEFLRASFLWHPSVRQSLMQQTKGAVMAGLNMGIIKKLPLPAPEMSRQLEWVNSLRSIEVLRQELSKKQALCLELSTSLKARAFQGSLSGFLSSSPASVA